MKTQKTNSIKTFSIMLFITAVCFGSGCSNPSNEKKENTSPEETIQSAEGHINMDIHTAAVMGNLAIIKEHLKTGTNINSVEPVGGSTPLISATVFGRTEVALELIRAGADLNAQNNEGSTALHSAAFFCRTEIVKVLLANGADKTIINKSGATAAHSVADDFKKVKGIYDFFGSQLEPLGLKLDYAYIENERSIIADILK